MNLSAIGERLAGLNIGELAENLTGSPIASVFESLGQKLADTASATERTAPISKSGLNSEEINRLCISNYQNKGQRVYDLA